ncbi:endonuclease-reverse transcriptase [Plakobranchus ocellatus]|uniref:Endonuclease-reverse transcriptase n=1 Tax=Plakobranchus ocellatus TaxID=259542 RepID=A0AAV3YQX6_9GAST|nr:endonuclease-reverse transcriptase [Plakobranchus ocellatus]
MTVKTAIRLKFPYESSRCIVYSFKLTNSKEPSKKEIKVNGQILESVTKFKYLGSVISDEGSKPEILSRIAQTKTALTKLKPISNNKNIAISSKIRLLRSLVMSIFLYACESWTLNADIERRIRAMEMRCHRRLLGISYKDHTTNEEASRRIENAIGPHVDLLTIVCQRKLKWYGHTTRSSGLAKTIMQGTVNGGRRRGRQKKRWDDNIREWIGLELRNTLRKVEDR